MFKKVVVGLMVLGMVKVFAMNVSELNNASKEELMQINGIGNAKAEAIIAERNKEKFKSIDDLTRVKGIGPKIAENVKNDVKVKEKTANK